LKSTKIKDKVSLKKIFYIKNIVAALYSIAVAMAALNLMGSIYFREKALALLLAWPIFRFSQYALSFKESKKLSIVHGIFAAVISFSLFAGKAVISRWEWGSIYTPVYGAVFACFLYSLIRAASGRLSALRLKGEPLKSKHIFLFSWGAIFLCWTPYFIAEFPTVMTFDSAKQAEMAMGIQPITDHHPIMHTLLIKLCLWIGGGSPWVYTLVQMLALSAMFAFAVYWINSKGLPKLFSIGALIWFAFNPVHAQFSVTMWKDVLFGGFMLLFTIALAELVITKLACFKSKSWLALFICSAVGACLFRSNGAIVVFAALLVLLCCMKKARKRLCVCTAVIAVLFMGVKIPVIKLYNAAPAHFAESVGIPLQQIARAVVSDGITPEQETKVERYLSIEKIHQNYDPYCVDGLKALNTNFHNEALENNKSAFFALWAELLISHPKAYAMAWLDETYGYWYPYAINHYAVWGQIFQNKLGVEANAPLPWFSNAMAKLYSLEIKITNTIFSMATVFYLSIFFAILAIRRKLKSAIILYLPLLILWFTLLIAAPIATDVRYLYSAFTILPIAAALPFIKTKKTEKGHRGRHKNF
jgi:hypothetical protein